MLRLLIFITALIYIYPFHGLAQTGTNPSKSSDTAYLALKKLLDKSLRSHNSRMAAKCNDQIGDIFFKGGAMPQALEYYYRASAFFKQNKDATGLADNSNKIGKIYYKNQRFTKASAYFNDALKLYFQKKDLAGIGETYGNIGLNLEKLGKLDSAYQYQQYALNAFLKIKDQNQILNTYSRIGGIYEDQQNFDGALHYFLMALKLSKNGTQKTDKPALLNNIGDTYRKMENYVLALRFTKEAEQLAIKMENPIQISSAHRDLAKTFHALGRYDSAYYYSEKARAAYAKSYNDHNDKQLNLLQTLFEVQHKNMQIGELHNEKILNRVISCFCLCFCGLLIVLGYFYFTKQKLKNSHNHLRYESERKAMAFELERKNKALSSFTLHMIRKNEFLAELTQKFNNIIQDDRRDQRRDLKKMIEMINDNTSLDQIWEDFKTVYEEIHENFFDRLKDTAPSLSPTDLRFLALTKMNLSSQEVATMLGISPESLRTTRYRVRKKLQLKENESLPGFLSKITGSVLA